MLFKKKKKSESVYLSFRSFIDNFISYTYLFLLVESHFCKCSNIINHIACYFQGFSVIFSDWPRKESKRVQRHIPRSHINSISLFASTRDKHHSGGLVGRMWPVGCYLRQWQYHMEEFSSQIFFASFFFPNIIPPFHLFPHFFWSLHPLI